MLMNKKELYTSPEVNVLVVRFEGVICQSELEGTGFEDPAGDIIDIDPSLLF